MDIELIKEKVNTLIDMCVQKYKYKKLPKNLSKQNRLIYEKLIQKYLNLKGDNRSLYSDRGIQLCYRYSRIVVGDYGAYVEINPIDMCTENIIIKASEQYRKSNKYKDRIKYLWFTTIKEDCKIYPLVRPVSYSYADYLVDKYYISVYEVFIN